MVSWPWEGRGPAPSRFQTSISFCPSGQCPRNRVRCEIQERDLCTNSRDCPRKMKCCMFSCGKKCLEISKGNSPIPWAIWHPHPYPYFLPPVLVLLYSSPGLLMTGLWPRDWVYLQRGTNPVNPGLGRVLTDVGFISFLPLFRCVMWIV